MVLAKRFTSQRKASREHYQNPIRRFTLPSNITSLKHFNENTNFNAHSIDNKITRLKPGFIKNNDDKNEYLQSKNTLPMSLQPLILENHIDNIESKSTIQANGNYLLNSRNVLNKVDDDIKKKISSWTGILNSNNKTLAFDVKKIDETDIVIKNEAAKLSYENLPSMSIDKSSNHMSSNNSNSSMDKYYNKSACS